MAACSGTQLTVDWFGLETDSVDVSDWTNIPDQDREKRCKIIHAIIHNHSLDHLGSILQTNWDINKVLMFPDHQKVFGYQSIKLMRCYKKRTTLHEAARQGWTEGVQVLLAAGAKCETSVELQNPLTLALQNADCLPELIELLLQNGADPNGQNTEQDMPLMCAITNCTNTSHLSAITRLLLVHGADPKLAGRVYIDKWVNSTALHEAARRGWTEGVRLLLEAGADCKVPGTSNSPLLLALHNPHCPADVVDLLLTHGVDPNQHSDILLQAISSGRNNPDITQIVKLLLERGVDPNTTRRINTGMNTHRGLRSIPHKTVSLRVLPEDIQKFISSATEIESSSVFHTAPQEIQRIFDTESELHTLPQIQAAHTALAKQWKKGEIKDRVFYMRAPEWLQNQQKAAAKENLSVRWETPLSLAREDPGCPAGVVELLLQYGADPGQQERATD